MPDDNGEIVTFITHSGPQKFRIPSGLSDSEAKAFVMSKRPDLFQTPEQQAPNANVQAKQVLQNIPQFTSPADQLRGQLANAQSDPNSQLNSYMNQSGQLAGTVAGTMATSGLFPAVKGAGMLQNIARLAGRSAATGLGAGTGAAAGGANPEEAAITAAGGVVGQPVAEGISSLFSAIKGSLPSALQKSAGQTLGAVKQVAGKVPVDTGVFGDTALQLWQEGQAGSQLPRSVSRLVSRITQPNGTPLTYAEAKTFQSNISALSTNERMALKPNTARLIGQLNGELKQSLEQASQLGGVDPGTFTGAMKQYSRAASQQELMDHLKEFALKHAADVGKAAVGGGAAGAAYGAYRAAKK